jgi:hypothetical protein
VLLQEISKEELDTKHKFAMMLQEEIAKLKGKIDNMQTANVDPNVPREL